MTAQEERRSAVDPRVVTTDQQRRNQDLLERRLAVLLYNNDLDFLEGAVRQRGLDRILLDTLSRDRMQQLALLPANARRAREELSALRDLGLVSMSQFDIISVQSTRLGQQVLCGIYPEHPDVIQSIAQQQRLVGRDALERCLRLTPAAEAAAAPSPQSRSREGFTIRPEMQQPLRQSFTLTDARGLSIPIVVPLETGRIWLRIETSSASPGFDPVLELRQEGIADPLANDDDSAGGRNARLDFEFAAGNYDLRLLRWGGGLGGATITVTRLTPAQVSALRPMDASEISLDGFAAPVPVPDAQLGGGLPIPVQIPADGTLLSFRLAEAQALVFDLAVVGIADLEMSLYRQNGRNLSFLLYNDDRPVTNGASDRQRLDPLIAMALEGGEYILRIRELSRRPVDATLRISRRTPEPPAQHAPTPTSPTLAPIQPSAPQIRR